LVCHLKRTGKYLSLNTQDALYDLEMELYEGPTLTPEPKVNPQNRKKAGNIGGMKEEERKADPG
jgi:hypothetical protein